MIKGHDRPKAGRNHPGIEGLYTLGNFDCFLIFGCAGSPCCQDFSLAGMRGLVVAAAALVAEYGLQDSRAQQLQLPGSRAQAQQLWLTGFAALWLAGPSRIRDRTCVLHLQADSPPVSPQGGPGGQTFWSSVLSRERFTIKKGEMITENFTY